MTKVQLKSSAASVIVLALTLLPSVAQAGRRVGNGDQLRLVFAHAKEHASKVVLKMHDRAIHPSVSTDVREWLLKNREALSGDIAASTHDWTTVATAACAETELSPAAPIKLSYPTCGNKVYSLDDAGQLLVHESVHHFDIADEAFADAVALAVYGASRRGEIDWTTTGAGTARKYGVAVWTGDVVLTVGGLDVMDRVISAPQKYDPTNDQWSALEPIGAPARFGMQAVWTGSQMLVWGGYVLRSGEAYWQNSGALYDPAADAWTPLATPYGQAELTDQIGNDERAAQTLVWTGREAVIFGGSITSSGRLPGGIFNPAGIGNAQWRPIPTAGAPDKVGGHTAVWADDKMIVWGGIDSARNKTQSGAVLNLTSSAGSWSEMSLSNAPAKRDGQSAIWTGAEMIVFGGDVNLAETQGTGGVYDPQTNTWTANFTVESVAARTGHAMVWTGAELLVYGGKPKQSSRRLMFEAVSAYDPVNQNWRVVDSKSAPVGRAFSSVVWTGASMIVLGGYDSQSKPLGAGGLFYP